MPSVHDTAYPRLRSSISDRDLAEVYTPTVEEVELTRRIARGVNAKLSFLVLLKTFQRLGYFMPLCEVPAAIVEHIAKALTTPAEHLDLVAYDEAGTRRRHVAIIRDHLKVNAFDAEAHVLLAQILREAAYTKEDLADLINIGIEELIRHRFELPGFSTLVKSARQARIEVNQGIYRQVAETLGNEGRRQLDQVLER